MTVKALSAIDDGATALAKIVAEARERLAATGRQTLVFVDEIGEWSKSQQRNLLPCTEDGSIVLIGATTANIGFSIIAPLLSRLTAYELKPLNKTSLLSLIQRAADHLAININGEARELLLSHSVGDGRSLLTLIEEHAIAYPGEDMDADAVRRISQTMPRRHDRAGDNHYALLSAMQKSIRGSDPDAAALYVGMLHQGGEPARNIFRRLIIMATEEVGLADPSVLTYVHTCAESYERVGEPEGLDLLMAAAIRIATSPKSNATHLIKSHVISFLAANPGLQPPRSIINAPTEQMKKSGFKEGYLYDHDFPDSFSGQEFMPDSIAGNRPRFYQPKHVGDEIEIMNRMAGHDHIRQAVKSNNQEVNRTEAEPNGS
jgi:putative ATPase